ncbi:MAG: hypothetical protein ABI175_21410, partial [Polyangiales bacterium]
MYRLVLQSARARPIALVFALAVACALLSGCRHHRRSAVRIVDPDLGTLEGRRFSAAELTEDVAFVRDHLEGKDVSPPPRARAIPGSRVFVTLFAPGRPPVVTSGLGKNIGESLVAAAEAARTPDLSPAQLRIQLDVVTRRVKAKSHDDVGEPGRFGLLQRDAHGRFGFALPTELFTRDLLGDEGEPELDVEGLESLVTERFGGACSTCTLARFETVSVIESGGSVQRLIGGLLPRPDPAKLDQAALRERIRLGADYLARMVGDDGKYVYIYDAMRDVDIMDDYSTIRHAGATDALFETYAELRDDANLVAGERALAYLDRRLRQLPPEGEVPERLYLADSGNAFAPIGGTGLSLIAFSAHAAVTGERTYLPRMQAMGRFLVQQLEPSGHFQPYFAPGVPIEKVKEVLYFPGEAMLGLLRLHAIDPQPVWLEAAQRAARYRLATPYEHPRDRHRDYWFALVLTELHALTHDPIWSERAFEIVEGTMIEQDDDERDVAEHPGVYDMLPRANPTSVALEAECAIASM